MKLLAAFDVMKWSNYDAKCVNGFKEEMFCFQKDQTNSRTVHEWNALFV